MSGFTLPTSRPITQAWAAEFDDWDGDGIVDYPGGFYNSIGWDGHNGIDYGCHEGDAIEAVADGIVAFANWAGNHWLLSGGGIAVLIEHPQYGVQSEYLHLSRTDLVVGQRVKKGQVIGRSGSTGASTAPHLHLGMLPLSGININNRMRGRINPTPYLYGNLNPDYAAAAIGFQSVVASPAPVEKESEMPEYKRVSAPPKTRRLAKGRAWPLIDAKEKSNLNFAVNGFGAYKVSLFLQGTNLPVGETLTVQFYTVTNGRASNYFAQEIDGTKSGNFRGLAQFEMPILKGPTSLEAKITSSIESAYIAAYGADVYTWKV